MIESLGPLNTSEKVLAGKLLGPKARSAVGRTCVGQKLSNFRTPVILGSWLGCNPEGRRQSTNFLGRGLVKLDLSLHSNGCQSLLFCPLTYLSDVFLLSLTLARY